MFPSDEQACAIALCEHLCIPWRYEPKAKEEWFGWNGESLNVAAKPAPSGGNLIHEIAHWLVAPLERRSLGDFGLSARGWSGHPFTPSLGCKFPDDEEALASMLGILMERKLGLEWWHSWELHQWDGWLSAAPWVRLLRKRDLLWRFTPTCLLGATSARRSR